MAWIAAIGSIAGGLMSANSSNKAAKAAQYRPWNTQQYGLGSASFAGGRLRLYDDMQTSQQNEALHGLGMGALGSYDMARQNQLGTDFLRNAYGQSQVADLGSLAQLQQAAQINSPYQNQDFMNVNGGMLGNFDPNQAAQSYTDMLRQQALPQEQQATASAMTGLFNKGRLGTTGGATQMGQLQQAQQQADLGRQIAGQQYGLQTQIQQQQAYDQARANQQGLMMNSFGANQQGAMNQFAMDQGLFQRNLDLYTNSSTATQDRFQRALQLFGGENAATQQYLNDFTGLLGARQSNQQQVMDLARIGASVGQAQTAANTNAAMIRNQGNQDLIAGFLGAANAYSNRNKGT